jgi:hypothetical protein
MEQNPSCEGNCISPTQEIFHILWKPKNNYHVSNSPPIFHILRQLKPLHVLLSHLFMTHLILLSYLCLCLPSCLFPSGLPTKTPYVFLFIPYVPPAPSALFRTCLPPCPPYPVRASCPLRLIPRHLITLITFF